ncbi:MAG: hypothetical protein K0U52_10810 [Gammaproteobacteria bacterium]|nr:hypothetical protein [Gammaproteobacteria bacterium]
MMGMLGAFAPLIAIWAIARSNLKVPNGRRTVPVIAKGEVITEGFVDGIIVNQPVYDMIKVRVEAPAMRFVYKTEWISKNGQRIRYAVVKHTGIDDGRRTYDVGDSQKNSSVFPAYIDGYYACQWTTFSNASANAYGSTGLKGWELRVNNRPLTLEAQTEYVDMLYDNQTAPEEEPSEPSEPEPLPPEVLPPSGLNPMLPPMGGLTTIEASEPEEEPVLIEEVIEEETVVVEEEPVAEINIEAVQNKLNRDRGLGGNNFGGFGV